MGFYFAPRMSCFFGEDSSCDDNAFQDLLDRSRREAMALAVATRSRTAVIEAAMLVLR